MERLSINDSSIEQAIEEVRAHLRGTPEEKILKPLYKRLTCDEGASGVNLLLFRTLINKVTILSAKRETWNTLVVDNPEGLEEALHNLVTAVKDTPYSRLADTVCITQWIRGRIKHDK